MSRQLGQTVNACTFSAQRAPLAALHNYAILLGLQTCMCASVQASLEVIKTAKKHINNDLMIRSTLCQNKDPEICVRGWLNPHVVSRCCRASRPRLHLNHKGCIYNPVIPLHVCRCIRATKYSCMSCVSDVEGTAKKNGSAKGKKKENVSDRERLCISAVKVEEKGVICLIVSFNNRRTIPCD